MMGLDGSTGSPEKLYWTSIKASGTTAFKNSTVANTSELNSTGIEEGPAGAPPDAGVTMAIAFLTMPMGCKSQPQRTLMPGNRRMLASISQAPIEMPVFQEGGENPAALLRLLATSVISPENKAALRKGNSRSCAEKSPRESIRTVSGDSLSENVKTISSANWMSQVASKG